MKSEKGLGEWLLPVGFCASRLRRLKVSRSALSWGGVRSGTVGACVSALAEHPALAERRLVGGTHLAKATGRGGVCAHTPMRGINQPAPLILNCEVTKNNLPAFIFPVYFVPRSPKFPTLFL